MKEMHAEQWEYTSNILRGLIANKDEEDLKVIGESMEEGIVGE